MLQGLVWPGVSGPILIGLSGVRGKWTWEDGTPFKVQMDLLHMLA
jgi:hypothetical protein